MVLVIFTNSCSVFGLFGAIDASAVNRLDQKPLEAYGYHDHLARNYFVFSLIIGILLHLTVNHSHFALMLQQK